MTVYVDDFRCPARVGRIRARWSHLTADTEPELLAFATQLGLNPRWIQHTGTAYVHFDVTDTVRTRALAAGAESITYRQLGQMIRDRRTTTRQEVTDA